VKSSHAPVTDESVARHFLAGRRFALVGASDNPKNFSRTVNSDLTDRGYEVVPVNPASQCVWGRRSYASVGEVPGHIDGVIVMVPAEAAVDVVRQCIDANVPNVWLFRGIGGPGSTSAAASELCLEAGVNLVDGACPLMFLEQAGWTHRFHHAIRVARGGLVDSDDVSSRSSNQLTSPRR